MGDRDWMCKNEDDYGCVVLEKRGKGEKYHICPSAGHQLVSENPQATANIILNELLGLSLPVLHPFEYEGLSESNA